MPSEDTEKTRCHSLCVKNHAPLSQQNHTDCAHAPVDRMAPKGGTTTVVTAKLQAKAVINKLCLSRNMALRPAYSRKVPT